MDEQLGAILVAVIGTIGAVVVAYVTRGKLGPPGAPPPTVESQTDRSAAALDAIVDELVEKRNELQDLRRDVWRCSIEHCPVRDQLRKEDR